MWARQVLDDGSRENAMSLWSKGIVRDIFSQDSALKQSWVAVALPPYQIISEDWGDGKILEMFVAEEKSGVLLPTLRFYLSSKTDFSPMQFSE